METRLCVANLSDQVSSADLKQLFSGYGIVVDAEVVVDSASGRSRGFGFVQLRNEAEAQAAIQALNGSDYLGHKLSIDEAHSGPRPGDFGDRSGKEPCHPR